MKRAALAAGALYGAGALAPGVSRAQDPDYAQYSVAGTFTKPQTIRPDAGIPLTLQQAGTGDLMAMFDSNGTELMRMMDIASNDGANAPVIVYTGSGEAWETGMDVGGSGFNLASRCNFPSGDLVFDVLSAYGDPPKVGIAVRSNYQFALKTDPLGLDASMGGLHIIHRTEQTGVALRISGDGDSRPSFQVDHDAFQNPKLTMIDCVIQREPYENKALKLVETALNAYGADRYMRTYTVRVTGDKGDRLRVRADGSIFQGDGNGTLDVVLQRAGAADWRLAVGSNERFRANSTGIGFNGAKPFAAPTLPPDATNPSSTQALVNAIKNALVKYGLAL